MCKQEPGSVETRPYQDSHSIRADEYSDKGDIRWEHARDLVEIKTLPVPREEECLTTNIVKHKKDQPEERKGKEEPEKKEEEATREMDPDGESRTPYEGNLNVKTRVDRGQAGNKFQWKGSIRNSYDG